jgi:hypothetical protein
MVKETGSRIFQILSASIIEANKVKMSSLNTYGGVNV